MKNFKNFSMVTVLLATLFAGRIFWASGNVFASPIISTRQAAQYAGQSVTVAGTVSGVHVSRKGNIFLNLDGRYPHQQFTGVIFSEYASMFPDVRSLQGQRIQIKGLVKLYRGKPEIVLTSRAQISGGQ